MKPTYTVMDASMFSAPLDVTDDAAAARDWVAAVAEALTAPLGLALAARCGVAHWSVTAGEPVLTVAFGDADVSLALVVVPGRCGVFARCRGEVAAADLDEFTGAALTGVFADAPWTCRACQVEVPPPSVDASLSVSGLCGACFDRSVTGLLT